MIEPAILTIDNSNPVDRRRGWNLFRAFNLTRLVIASALLGLYLINPGGSRVVGQTEPMVFLWASSGYILLVVASMIASSIRRPSLQVQTHLQTVVDLIALSLLIYASGGISSSLTILLITAVAGAGIMLPLASAMGSAAGAFFIIAGAWLVAHWLKFAPTTVSGRLTGPNIFAFFDRISTENEALIRIGVLGVSFFIAALITNTLAERTRRSEALVRQRTQELNDMAQMNQAIVEQLHDGVVVVNRFARVKLANQTARDLLGKQDTSPGDSLSDISEQLGRRLAEWLSTGANSSKPFRQAEHTVDLSPRFASMGKGNAADTLIFLEDYSEANQRLQQIKLAALGRLTAGIAHEVRNPLSSISHAAQLMEESNTASDGDRRLGQIIHENARRANQIIANVLDLFRREKAKPELFKLDDWLTEFCTEFARGGEDQPMIETSVQPIDLEIRFDPSHLHQILWNLAANANKYGHHPGEKAHIRIGAAQESERMSYLDVIDHGPGIPEDEAKKIFEPFYTSQAKGTGLGLYIAREMCEANRAQLQYVDKPGAGGCFRISFPAVGNVAGKKPKKQEEKWMLAMR